VSSKPVEGSEGLEHVVSPGEVEGTLVSESSRLASVVGRRCRYPKDERVEEDEEDRIKDSEAVEFEDRFSERLEKNKMEGGEGNKPKLRPQVRSKPSLSSSPDRDIWILQRVQDSEDGAAEVLG